MMRVSKLTDYAVVLLSQLPDRHGMPIAVSELAERTGVPDPTVAKVLKTLVPAGLVVSFRGANGGYRLGRPADEISVGAVIAAMEGPIAVTACVSTADVTCSVEQLCPMRGNWDRVNHTIQSALENVSLADMARPGLTRVHALDATSGPSPLVVTTGYAD